MERSADIAAAYLADPDRVGRREAEVVDRLVVAGPPQLITTMPVPAVEAGLQSAKSGVPCCCSRGATAAHATSPRGWLRRRDDPLWSPAAEGDCGLFCGMGVCGECSMIINGQPSQLSCMVMVAEGMRVRRQPARVPVETKNDAAPFPESELTPDRCPRAEQVQAARPHRGRHLPSQRGHVG